MTKITNAVMDQAMQQARAERREAARGAFRFVSKTSAAFTRNMVSRIAPNYRSGCTANN